jgi:SAM-dependent methyltransferase
MPIAPPKQPQELYRLDLRDRIAAIAPESLLDVGCGKGELLRAATLTACPRRVGLEVATADVGPLREQGVDVRQGRAEALPFEDRSFDVVVLEYVAHHLEDLERGLAEAARVARIAVLVLDPWYDLAVPSQRVAREFDEWLKVIDRRTGLVHNSCPSAADLAAPFLALGGFAIDYSQRLALCSVPMETLEATARDQLAQIPSDGDVERSLQRILAQARRDGMSEDGALLLSAARH